MTSAVWSRRIPFWASILVLGKHLDNWYLQVAYSRSILYPSDWSQVNTFAGAAGPYIWWSCRSSWLTSIKTPPKFVQSNCQWHFLNCSSCDRIPNWSCIHPFVDRPGNKNDPNGNIRPRFEIRRHCFYSRMIICQCIDMHYWNGFNTNIQYTVHKQKLKMGTSAKWWIQ